MAYNYALNSVYNNYLTTYAPKETGRYDTHKKSELRGIYNSIVKLNKESPLSIIDTSQGTQQFAIEMKENARALKNTIASLGGLDENELLSQKTAYSSNHSVVSANFIGSYDGIDPDISFTVFVEQLAQSQENTGNYLETDKMGLDYGSYSFDISINNMNYEFQFNINEGETNFELQNKLARLINNSNIGLKAEVKELDNRTALSLESNATGIKPGSEYLFRISDDQTSRTAGAVDYLGLNLVSRQPQNARFYLNDNPSSSYSNHFTVEKTFELNLNSIQGDEDAPVRIGLKTDTESLSENITEFVRGYNEFLRGAAKYSGSQPKSGYLVKEMNFISGTYAGKLQSLGLSMLEDGQISIDSDQLKQAVSLDDARDNFASMRKFANSVLNKTNQVSLNPMNYVQKTIVVYKNPGKEFASPYITSQYSGMMFNGYC